MKLWVGLGIGVVGLLLIIFATFSVPTLQARWLLNTAQLQRLHGTSELARFTAALTLAPANSHLRWQAAEVAAANDDCDYALELLEPIASELSPLGNELMLRCLLATEQDARAAQFYSQYTPRLQLASGLVVRLLYGLSINPDAAAAVSPRQTAILIANLTNTRFRSPFFQAWVQTYLNDDFWQQEQGQRLAAALDWLRHTPAAQQPVGTAAGPDPALVATLLELPPAAVQLGPELIANGAFGGYQPLTRRIPNWQADYWQSGTAVNFGLFVLGTDAAPDLSQQTALRISNIYRETNPDLPRTRAGFWHAEPITLTAQTAYVLHFQYRTHAITDEGPALFLTEANDVMFRNDRRFAPSEGQWQHVTVIGWNQSERDRTVRPLLRLWSLGDVWFTDVSMREVRLALDFARPPQAAIIHIAPVP